MHINIWLDGNKSEICMVEEKFQRYLKELGYDTSVHIENGRISCKNDVDHSLYSECVDALRHIIKESENSIVVCNTSCDSNCDKKEYVFFSCIEEISITDELFESEDKVYEWGINFLREGLNAEENVSYAP